MATEAWGAQDFLGITPGIDPRRSDKFYALNGSNYVFDSIGPKSAFGNRMLTPYPLGVPEHTQGFRLKLRSGDRCFTMVGDSILEWDEAIGGWLVRFITPNTILSPYRWTFGYLNGYVYFCHPRTGLLVMSVEDDIILPVTSDGAPEQAIAMVINNGRLCVINDTTFFWSAPSNGLDWTPRLGGPGFQVINDRVSGDPVMVTSYTGGCLTWTTGGVMRSEFTGDVEVYRHRNINTEYRMINSFCSIQIDDNNVVILDERGLFQSKGEAPQPFAPLFNEFLIGFIQTYNLKVGQNIRLEWDDLRRQLFLSYSLSEVDALYESCFVYYPPMDKWGQFNESHYGIIPLRIDTGGRADDYFGFVGADSIVRYWAEYGSREIIPASGFLNSAYPLIQKPAHEPDGEPGTILSSSFVVNTVADTEDMIPAGFFPRDGTAPVAATLTGLGASIQLGLLRFPQQTAFDMMTEVTQVIIGNLVSGDTDRVSVDYNIIPAGVDDEDYNEEVGEDNFGVDEINYINHGLRIISTNDGRTEFQSAIPQLTLFERGARYYSCSTSGVWHILEMTAEDIGEAFHLRVFELTAAGAGRLS